MDYSQRKQKIKAMLHALKTRFWYRIFLRKCGKSTIVMPPFYLSLKEMALGDHVLIYDHARIEAVCSYEGQSFQPRIVFHDHVQIQQNLHMTCASHIELGRFTSLGANVTITDIHHPYEDINLPIEKQPIQTREVIIGEECKIYNNAVILPGTILGKHCTVGANSVVSGTFPDFSVIVGAPAKVVKRYSITNQSWLKTDHVGNFLNQ